MQIGSQNIKAVIWDWNGTLLNDIDICIYCVNKLLENRNIKTINREKYVDIFTFPVRDYYEKAGFDFSKEKFEVPAMEFIHLYYQNLKNAKLFSESESILQEFKQQGIKQYVLSAMEHKSLVKSLKDYGIYDFFIDINGIDNHYAHSKLDIGRGLSKNIPFEKNEIILVGDTLHDKDVADGLGVNHILLANGHQSKKRLQEKTSLVLNNMHEFLNLIN